MVKYVLLISSLLLLALSLAKSAYDAKENLLVAFNVFIGKVSYLEAFTMYHHSWIMLWDFLIVCVCFVVFTFVGVFLFDD